MPVAREKPHNHIDWFHFKFRITNLQVDPRHCLEVLLCFPGLSIPFSLFHSDPSPHIFLSSIVLLCSLSPPTKFPNWCPYLIINWKDKSNSKRLKTTNFSSWKLQTNMHQTWVHSHYPSSIFAVWPQSVCFFSSFSAFRFWLKHYFLRKDFLD